MSKNGTKDSSCFLLYITLSVDEETQHSFMKVTFQLDQVEEGGRSSHELPVMTDPSGYHPAPSLVLFAFAGDLFL